MNSASQSSRSYDFLWLSLALLFLLPIAFLLSITPHDYWFYVRVGKDILESGAVPDGGYIQLYLSGQPDLLSTLAFGGHLLAGTFCRWRRRLRSFCRGICIAIAYGLLWTLMREAGTGTKLATLLTILLGLLQQYELVHAAADVCVSALRRDVLGFVALAVRT